MKQTVSTAKPQNALDGPKTGGRWARFKKEAGYHVLIWPALIFVIIFCYIPMGGIVVAFKDFNIRRGIWDSPWNGIDNFRNIFLDSSMGQVIINTLGIGILNIVVSFPVVVGFAILLNEVRNIAFKRVVQTVSYLPHFVAWTVMAIILKALFDANGGIISDLLMDIGITDKPLNVLTSKDAYWGLAVWSAVWKEMGWSAILYLAVMAGIDSTLYEAAEIDGAGRFGRIWYITLPHLKGIIAISLIMTVGSILGVGFDQAYYLKNNLNSEMATTLSYYVWDRGLSQGNFGYSTAISLVLSAIGAFLTTTSNIISKKLTGKGLY